LGGDSVYTKGIQGANDDQDGGPAVIQGEREADENFISIGHCWVLLLDNIVDVLKYNTVSRENYRKGKDGRTVTAELTKIGKTKAATKH
jgi:hypothetical protein